MSSNIKFNKNVGIALSETMHDMAVELAEDTKKMLEALQQLHEYYKDEEYDVLEANITAVMQAMTDTCTSFTDMAKAINDYTNRLFS